MNKLVGITATVCICLFVVSCVTKATEDECKQMCENLIGLRGQIDMSTVAERTAKVEESFKREEKRLKDWLKRDLDAWDEELKAKLAELKKDDEKKKLTEEYEKKKEVTRQKHLPGLKELGPKKETAINEAQKKAAESKAEFDKAVEECRDDAVKEGVPQSAVQCRIKATSTDQYWNVCR